MRQHKKQIIIGAVVLVVLLALFGTLYAIFMPKGQAGAKQIGVQVVLLDETSQAYQISTDADNLGDALKQEELIKGEEGPYGLFITEVAGVTADEGAQQWWCITKSGEMVNTGADMTPIADGDQFEITLKEGYEDFAS